MPTPEEFEKLLSKVDFSDEESIRDYALHLEGMTLRDVLGLGIYSPAARERMEKARGKAESAGKQYDSTAYKGGAGNLIEERYFAYDANSDERPDFPEAGVELKTTCYDVKKDGEPSAGERLVVTMVPFDRGADVEFDSSHCWEKSRRILLVYYERDKSVEKYDQQIKYVMLFTPPEDDLRIIRDDYDTIVRYVREGRADELSEGLTTYLGACTKGASEAKMWVTQQYPYVHEDGSEEYRRAKKRAFSLKRQYMDYVLHKYVIPEHEARFAWGGESAKAELSAHAYDACTVITEPLRPGETFEDRLAGIVEAYVGQTDRQLCALFGLEYTGNKSQWVTLSYRVLGVSGGRVEEFEKANISLRTVRVEEDGTIEQSLSLDPFEFEDLAGEGGWYDSWLYNYLEEKKFFFVMFEAADEGYRLRGSKLWNMPEDDIEDYAHAAWRDAREAILGGVKIERRGNRYMNNLPGISDNPVIHVRPHTKRRAYLLGDGTEIGDIKKDGSRLPDGRYMTRQSFWINSGYLEGQLLGELDGGRMGVGHFHNK